MWTALPNGSKMAATSRSTYCGWCHTLVIGTEINSANAPGRLTPMPECPCTSVVRPARQLRHRPHTTWPSALTTFARKKIFHVLADFSDFAYKFVPDDHGSGDGFLSPFIPLVDVHVGAANAGAVNMDEHVVNTDLRLGNFLEPKPWFALFLDKCFHIRRTGGVRFPENPSSIDTS